VLNSYPIIYEELKKIGYLFSAPEGIEEILKRNIDKEFVLVDVKNEKGKTIGQKWWLKGAFFLDRVPVSERVETVTVNLLNREYQVTFDEVLKEVYMNFTNALTPDTESVKEALEEYAEKTKDGKWRLKPDIKQRETQHNSMIEKIAIIGKKAGFKVHADLTEWRGRIELDLPLDKLERIKEIDAIWYNETEITHEFEVENTTGITDAVVRGSNIPSLKTKRYIVIPEERQEFFLKKISEPMLK
jgi:Tfp pilus assembly protein PilP